MSTSAANSRHAGVPPGYSGRKSGHLARLAGIEGRVRHVTRMVEDGGYHVDALDEISNITRALQEVALDLLDDHLRRCVVAAARFAPAEAGADAELREVAAAMRRTLRP